jgi:hypothetical protein
VNARQLFGGHRMLVGNVPAGDPISGTLARTPYLSSGDIAQVGGCKLQRRTTRDIADSSIITVPGVATMTVYDDIDTDTVQAAVFEVGDPVEIFDGLQVYVELDPKYRDCRPVVERFPGHPGQWICAYSSLERLLDMRWEGIDYSCVSGRFLLGRAARDVGLWYDPGYPHGRKILLPSKPFQLDTPCIATADVAGEPDGSHDA